MVDDTSVTQIELLKIISLALIFVMWEIFKILQNFELRADEREKFMCHFCFEWV